MREGEDEQSIESGRATASANQPIVAVQFDSSWASMMDLCICGAMFQASGKPDAVKVKQQAWLSEHKDCVASKRDGTKVFWLSFCDADRPKGQQFLGACVIQVTAEDADEAAIDVLLRFPFAQPDAEWLAAAIKKTHRLGCNPGGEVALMEIPADHPNLSHYTMGVLMDRATIERIDQELAPEPPK